MNVFNWGFGKQRSGNGNPKEVKKSVNSRDVHTIQVTGPDVFVNSALQNTSIECRIMITEFQKLYSSLSEGFKKQGLSGSQITDILWTRLSTICPECGRHMTGEDLGNLWLMGGFGESGRFGKGNCPSETCSSTNIVFRWETHPPDDLSPFTPQQDDREALKTYWNMLAQQWWNDHSSIKDTVCGKCYQVSIPKGEGYFSNIFSDLFCESCCARRLAPNRIDMIYKDKTSITRDELRMAREYRAKIAQEINGTIMNEATRKRANEKADNTSNKSIKTETSKNLNFIMRIDQIFPIKGRGIFVAGHVEKLVRVGDSIKLIGSHGVYVSKIKAIDNFNKPTDHVDPGHFVGLQLEGLAGTEAKVGDLIEQGFRH